MREKLLQTAGLDIRLQVERRNREPEMNIACYPISILPHTSRLFLDYTERREPLRPFYSVSPYSNDWMTGPAPLSAETRARAADLLAAQNRAFGAGQQALENIERLRNGANAVVTGQQVTLFGGPLFTLFKAATAIRKAQDATRAGHPHVPIFWLATEDHDLAEANHVSFPARRELRRVEVAAPHHAGEPVGGVALGDGIKAALDQAAELVGFSPALELLEQAYQPDATFGSAFARWIAAVFAEQGLIVIDASSREWHALGADVLRKAITEADTLQDALTARDALLAEQGYHSQVLVSKQSSLLFLLDAESGARIPLRRTDAGTWTAARKSYTDADLLAILDTEPERISPNALLRAVFQDSILPTSAYIGGPAEIAYFAQSQVVYEQILGRTTPVLPRLSATLVEPAVASLLEQHEVSVDEILSSRPVELAQKLGARAIPVEGKRKLASAGNALDEELNALTAYMHSLDPGVGRAADVSASKMRYQMNRLRRIAANFQLQKEASLLRHAEAMFLSIFPGQHPQERIVGASYFLGRYGDSLPALLVEHAAQECPGHKAIYL
jgi:bacillithiol biosynthesis cysteine-adding enzyme BshC